MLFIAIALKITSSGNELHQAQIESHMLHHKMQPGITDWAQVHGSHGETRTLDKTEARVKLDLFYIEH